MSTAENKCLFHSITCMHVYFMCSLLFYLLCNIIKIGRCLYIESEVAVNCLDLFIYLKPAGNVAVIKLLSYLFTDFNSSSLHLHPYWKKFINMFYYYFHLEYI